MWKAVLQETATIAEGRGVAHHDFVFVAESGVRYEVAVRVGQGSGASRPCTENAGDPALRDAGFAGGCDDVISSGLFSCANDLAPGGAVRLPVNAVARVETPHFEGEAVLAHIDGVSRG